MSERAICDHRPALVRSPDRTDICHASAWPERHPDADLSASLSQRWCTSASQTERSTSWALGRLAGSSGQKRSAPDHAVVVDELTPELAAILARVNPRIVLYLTSSTGNHNPAWRQLQPVGSEVGRLCFLGRSVRSGQSARDTPPASWLRLHGLPTCPLWSANLQSGRTTIRGGLDQRRFPRRLCHRRGERSLRQRGRDGYYAERPRSTPGWTCGDSLRTPMSAWTWIRGHRSPANASSRCATGRRSSCRRTLGRRRCMRVKAGAGPSGIPASCSPQ